MELRCDVTKVRILVLPRVTILFVDRGVLRTAKLMLRPLNVSRDTDVTHRVRNLQFITAKVDPIHRTFKSSRDRQTFFLPSSIQKVEVGPEFKAT